MDPAITKKYGVTDDQMDRLKAARNALNAVEREVSDTVMAHIGFSKGDLVIDNMTGLQYRVDSASGYVGMHDRIGVTVWGRRVWRTGRKAGREAYTSSVLHTENLEKVKTDG